MPAASPSVLDARSSASRARRRSRFQPTCARRRSTCPLVTSRNCVPLPRFPDQLLRHCFHTYFVTHLPSSSLHPDSHRTIGPGHKLPRDASTPHTPSSGPSPAAVSIPNMQSRDLTVVRIPLRRAKHHFGSATARGSRPYNEDADQAGTVDIPAFAKRGPLSVRQKPGEPTPADSVLGDPQIFYFGVFDGHGGTQCSHFLRDELHGYIEEAALEFGLQSSLRKSKPGRDQPKPTAGERPISNQQALDSVDMKSAEDVQPQMDVPDPENRAFVVDSPNHEPALPDAKSPPAESQNMDKAISLERDLVKAYRNAVGGYFRRFNPEHFDISSEAGKQASITVESSLAYAFLRADLDFVSAQARKADPDASDQPLNDDEILGAPHTTPSGHGIGGTTRFKGGSTASVALISTPTTAPFWHPAAHSTLVAAHVGDSRILLCETATGLPHPLTSDHHPTTPTESRRLRRYAPAGSMVTGDSFGEERIAGLANSRAFGDIRSKRIGVSAEPEITRVEMGPAEFSFLVLMSDGVSGTLSDQEIVDIVKEARTPDDGARNIVEYATEVSKDGDNATCQVVRLGGWERRSEGGLGSMGTKEIRDIRKAEAQDPRRGKR
ncbi:Protein phosphatase 2C domain containing protein [Metarhizium album ARSEF 1941]|uniref:Protein phosphatase 2C domain containing protein n=1 Tax=Metarhizium album (strain ARSEF 1941) TaxID=1081103 RepID=A0A0B2X6B8_METAS|nr:Protein phosphatase 2C domain containing protein [Metarhizium album ARSEF 1941]KHO01934.1 Protein phosphatase 2C domain containing protein [Metarhizium album ARSEF 1941]